MSIIKGASTRKLARKTKRLARRSKAHVGEHLTGERINNVYLARNHIVGWLLAVAGLVFLVGLQFILYQNSYRTEAFARGGVYAEATLGNIATLNPLFASTNSEKTASRLVFSSLFDHDTTGHIQGDLADRLTISDDGRTYTVTLKDGIKWHDGEAVTLDDVLFTVNTIKDPRSRSLLSSGWSDVTAQINENAVEFRLPSAYPAFIDLLTFAVLPEHILGDVAPGAIYSHEFSTKPVGSGPFKFQLLQTMGDEGKIVHLVSNNDYYRGAPKLDRFQLHTATNQDEVARDIKTGAVNASADLDASFTNQLSGGQINLREAAISRGVYAFINMQSPLLKEIKVRQALKTGINMEHVRNELSPNTLALNTPILPTQISINVPAATPVNQDDAIQSLESAGFRKDGDKLVDSDGNQIGLKLVALGSENYRVIADALAEQIEQLGINVEKEIFDANDPTRDFLQEVLQPRAYDILIYEIELGSDPDVFAYWHSSQIGSTGFNLSNYSSTISDDLLSTARTARDTTLRRAKYQSFVDRWSQDIPALGIYQVQMQYFYNKNVRPFGEDVRLVSPLDRFSDVLYWANNKAFVFKTP